MMPMMPEGMAATVTVDLAAISIALTEAGKGLVAVTLSAAHCKVNVSASLRIRPTFDDRLIDYVTATNLSGSCQFRRSGCRHVRTGSCLEWHR